MHNQEQTVSQDVSMGIAEKNRERPTLGITQVEKRSKNSNSQGVGRRSNKELLAAQGDKLITGGSVKTIDSYCSQGN